MAPGAMQWASCHGQSHQACPAPAPPSSSRRVARRAFAAPERGRAEPGRPIGPRHLAVQGGGARTVFEAAVQAGAPGIPRRRNWLTMVLASAHQGARSPCTKPLLAHQGRPTGNRANLPPAVGRATAGSHGRPAKGSNQPARCRPKSLQRNWLSRTVSRVLSRLVSSGIRVPIPPRSGCGHCSDARSAQLAGKASTQARAGAASSRGGRPTPDCGAKDTVVAPAGSAKRQRQAAPRLITTQTVRPSPRLSCRRSSWPLP